MNDVINLKRLWEIIRRNLWKMICLGIIFGGVAFGIAKYGIQPKYSASTALLVNRKTDEATATQYADQQADVQMISTYKDIITRPIILNTVTKNLTQKTKTLVKAAEDAKYTEDIYGRKTLVKEATKAQYKINAAKYSKQDINADDLAEMITISSETDSQVFTVSVESNDAMMSRDVANEVAKVFKDKVAAIMNVSNVSIVSKATTDETPVSPNVKLITLVGVVLGIFIGFLWGFIKELTDRTIKDMTYFTEELGLTNLGTVNYIWKIRNIQSVLNENANTTQSERGSRLSRRI